MVFIQMNPGSPRPGIEMNDLLIAWLMCVQVYYMINAVMKMTSTNMAFHLICFPAKPHVTHETGIQNFCFRLLILLF